jgi:peptidoglycan DL-endopeptidase CwlO
VANRLSRRFRPVMVASIALGAAAAVCIPSVALASPQATPKPAGPPSISTVQKQLGQLTIQNTQLVEKYNQARIAVAAKQRTAAAAALVATEAEDQFATAERALGATVTVQYESGTFSTTGALLSSSNDENYLDQMASMALLSNHTAQQVAQLQDSRRTADAAQAQAKRLLSSAAATLASLASQKKHLAAEISKYTTLLNTLNAAQRKSYLKIADPTPSSSQAASAEKFAEHAGSKAALIAVKFAEQQMGKPYSWGAAGPGSYDCSGLTMRAWGAAGVSLPHSAADQYNYGHHVPATVAALEPGDLIFFYHPIGHVTIYVGQGMMVSAPETGEDVTMVSMSAFKGQIVGATRLT